MIIPQFIILILFIIFVLWFTTIISTILKENIPKALEDVTIACIPSIEGEIEDSKHRGIRANFEIL